MPYTLRNPLYHWSHLELQRYFGIDDLITEDAGPGIWKVANAKLAQDDFRVHGILDKNRVAVVVTTDDPADSLEYHQQIRGQKLKTRVYPAFRPDAALKVENPNAFNSWCGRLAAASNTDLATFSDFLAALKKRHDFFHGQGCRLSDHGLSTCFAAECDEKQAAGHLRACPGRPGGHTGGDASVGFPSHALLRPSRRRARLDEAVASRAPCATTTRRMFEAIGPDTGYDSIGDFPQAAALSFYLDRLNSNGDLPKVILYNVNPVDNYVLATMIANFQDGSVPGKMQFGSGWWFLDQIEGMTWQLNALSNLGLLRRFVGMLTDSRSFLSYTRHEYFRRLLCNLLGNDVEKRTAAARREPARRDGARHLL